METSTELDKESFPKKTTNPYPDRFPDNNYYQALFKDAPIGVVLSDNDGVLLRVNKAVCAMLGYTEDELVGKNINEISLPEDMKTNMSNRKKLITGEVEEFKMEKRYIHKDGHIVWGRLTVSNLKVPEVEEHYLMAHLEDITLQKNAEAAFAEIEDRYRTLFKDAPLPLWEFDMSELKTYLDKLMKSVSDLSGYFNSNYDEMVKQLERIKVTNANDATLSLFKVQNIDKFAAKSNIKSIMNDKTLKLFFEKLINLIKSKSEITFNLSTTDVLGEKLDLLVGLFVAPEHQKTWSRVLCTNFDMTKQKNDEAALRESEDKYKKLIEIANDAIFVVDAKSGEITEVNKRAATIVGTSQQKLVGTPFSSLFYVDNLDLTSKDIENLIDKKGGHIREVLIKNSKNELIPVELSSNLVRIGQKKFIQSTARNLSERYRSRELREALDRINESIHSTLDFKEIMKRLVGEACKTLGDTVGIFIKEDRYWIAEYFEGSLKDLQGTHFTEDEVQVATLAENSMMPVISNDTLTDDRFNKDMMKVSKMKSILLVPLLIKNQVIGALCFAYSKKPVPFSESEIDFGVKLGSTVSLAIENARMYGSEHHIANTLQEALLKMPPSIKGLEFGHLYKSSTEIAKVGGDFFDIFELDDDVVAILIGDVSGKGLDAASLTSSVKNSLRAYLEIEKSPSMIVKMTSEFIRKTLRGSMYVTIFFGLLSRKTGNMVYCCAGHPPPIVRTESSGKTYFLDSTSTVIGQFPDIEYKESEVILFENDLLFAYTDGLTEARDNEDFFGEARLSSSIVKNKEIATSDLPMAIFKESKDFANSKLLDDIAILAISLKKSV